VRVQRRHIIYVQGYDPRGLAQYYRMFRTELRKSDQLYGIESTIGRPQSSADGSMASWTIDSQGDGWQTHTSYDFLRWEDLIQQDLVRPIWRTVLEASAIYWQLMFGGIVTRFWRAHWRFATFITYPHFVLFNEIVWSLGVAWLLAAILGAIGAPGLVTMPVAAVAFVAMLWALLKYTEKRTYLLYLMADTIFTWRFAHRQRPDWDERIGRFAAYLAEVARSSDAEEIIIVGHSSGSFLGLEILARALQLDPALGQHGPRVALLTVGGNLPILGFLPVSSEFRQHLRQLAVEPSVDWIDCQSRKDVMNFYPFDPIAGHGIDVGAARRNPVIVPVRFREIIDPGHYNRFRWQFFRVHFQFVMANERPHPYDFFMIVRGPIGLMDRVREPQKALAAVTGPAGSAKASRPADSAHCGSAPMEHSTLPNG
jgi:pimeloyl-ACP methyl ester carboxylesterase